MRSNLLLLLALMLMIFNCKDDASSKYDDTQAIDTEATNATAETEKPAPAPITHPIDTADLDDAIKYSGVWFYKSTDASAKLMLNHSNDKVTGSLVYSNLNEKKEKTKTETLKIAGTIANDILTADVLDPNGTKISTAQLQQSGKDVTFTLTGKKLNVPSKLTLSKK